MSKKGIVTLAVAVGMLLPMQAQAAFGDVSASHQHYTAINALQEKGIVSGHPDGTYRADDMINRAEFLKIIVETRYTQEEIDNCDIGDKYPDVMASEWYANYVCVATAESIVSGYPNGMFMPGQNINYAEGAKMIVEGLDVPKAPAGQDWFDTYTMALVTYKSQPRTDIMAADMLTRGEMAQIIYNLSMNAEGNVTLGKDMMTVGETAASMEDFSTLTAALTAGDLVETLNGDGPFTVFAPTNAAFAAIQSTVDSLLLPENKEMLQTVLTYHVVPGKFTAADLTDGMTLTTVQGTDLVVTIVDGKVLINGATVTAADVETSNGVVHAIDMVLVPQDEATEDSSTVVDLVVGSDMLSTLEAAVVAADLVETLNGDGPFTVFAPTNDAFAAIQSTVDDLLLPENKETLRAVLSFHVVPGSFMASDLTDGMKLMTVQGTELTVSVVDGKVMINGATVTTADLAATNGVAHVIDTVLVP